VFLILVALTLALSVGVVACAQPAEEEEEEEEEQLSISDLKGPDWMKYVGTVVTVEGIFVRDPIPMLLTDLDIVKVNSPMPEDQYIILAGDQAEDIDPAEYGGAKLKVTGNVVAMNPPVDPSEHVAVDLTRWEVVDFVERYYIELVDFRIGPCIPQPNRYAILFNGGIGPADNHLRFWNDLKFMYSTLINKYGYAPDRITVLYGDGSPPDDPATHLPDTSMPVDHSGTQANLESVFKSLKATTTSKDFIFVFATNHGGGFCKECPTPDIYGGQVDTNADEPGTDVLSETHYGRDLNGDGVVAGSVSWDEELCSWGGRILDDAFSDMFANLAYRRMVIVMGTCFSGGFIYDMRGSNRIIISAASEYEFGWSMLGYPFDEFSYYFTCAINGADERGNPVDADTNNDGQVSMVEAFNYAVSEDEAPETPYYEDDGDGVPHSGPVPAAGDGTLGSNTFLS